MKKWMRNYKAIFEIGERKGKNLIPRATLEIAYPFTCKFELDLGIYKSANRGIFQFINLSRSNQELLWLDPFNIGEKYIIMSFYAGYGDNMPMLFTGFVQGCSSYKQGGSTEFITEMQVYDGGLMIESGYLNATFTKGTTLEDILRVATEGLKNISVGYVSPGIEPLKKDRTFIGQPLDLLRRNYAGYQVYIDKGELNILGENDIVPGEVQVITDSTGLLGSPKRANGLLYLDTVFEPQLKVGQPITILSNSKPWLNQSYKIQNIKHKGVISPNICDKLITSITMTLGSDFNELEKAPPTSYTGKPTEGQWLKPVQGRVSSPFGYRNQPNAQASKFHKGMDIASPLNTPVYAPANGKIIASYISGSLTTDYGRLVKIDHGEINGKKVTSLYGHLNKWLVGAGDVVSKGQTIALVGSTGNSTGPHLHFGIYENDTPVNPAKYIGTYG